MGNAVHYCKLHKLIAGTVAVAPSWEATCIKWRQLEDTLSTNRAAVLLKGLLVIMGGHSHDTNGLRISSRQWQI